MKRFAVVVAVGAFTLLAGCQTTGSNTRDPNNVTDCATGMARCTASGQIERCSVEGKWQAFPCSEGLSCVDSGHGQAACQGSGTVGGGH